MTVSSIEQDVTQQSAEAVLDRIVADGVRLVDLGFSDITGAAKAVTVPAELLGPILDHGYRFDGAALTGGPRLIELDLYLVPDPATLIIFAADGGPRRALLACSVHRRGGQPFAGDPRSILERALAAAVGTGYDYRVAMEIEYYLFPEDESATVRTDPAGYFDLGDDIVAATRDEIVATLHGMGVGIGGAHHETGPGQEELDLWPTGALRMADQVIIVRQVIRSVAARRGLRVSFMAKPRADAPGSGMHIFQRMVRLADGADALYADEDQLSAVGRQAIAGQLAHAPAMSAILCPTVNSYKRLAAGHRAPRHATWARVSQASLIRVPSRAPGEHGSIELELRLADPMANPYLALAVALSCALDGVQQGEEPPEPLDETLVRYDDEELRRLGVPSLPSTLGDALAVFADDEVVRGALGEYVVDQLLTVKQAEWDEYRRYVSPWEQTRYGG